MHQTDSDVSLMSDFCREKASKAVKIAGNALENAEIEKSIERKVKILMGRKAVETRER